MKKNFYFLGLCLVVILIGSCASAPETKPVSAAETQVEEKSQQVQEPAVVEKPVEQEKKEEKVVEEPKKKEVTQEPAKVQSKEPEVKETKSAIKQEVPKELPKTSTVPSR